MIISNCLEKNHGKSSIMKNAQFAILESMNTVFVHVVLAEIKFTSEL